MCIRDSNRTSINKKAIKYSFTYIVTLDQLANKQIGISSVVNNKKKIEIPSIPKVKFILDWDNQTISSTN